MLSLPFHSPTVDASPLSRTTTSGLVIDLSAGTAGAKDELAQYASSMVAWVETLPRQSGIHIRLPSVHHRTSMRRLQRTLQSLGCTVTCRMQLSH